MSGFWKKFVEGLSQPQKEELVERGLAPDHWLLPPGDEALTMFAEKVGEMMDTYRGLAISMNEADYQARESQPDPEVHALVQSSLPAWAPILIQLALTPVQEISERGAEGPDEWDRIVGDYLCAWLTADPDLMIPLVAPHLKAPETRSHFLDLLLSAGYRSQHLPGGIAPVFQQLEGASLSESDQMMLEACVANIG